MSLAQQACQNCDNFMSFLDSQTDYDKLVWTSACHFCFIELFTSAHNDDSSNDETSVALLRKLNEKVSNMKRDVSEGDSWSPFHFNYLAPCAISKEDVHEASKILIKHCQQNYDNCTMRKCACLMAQIKLFARLSSSQQREVIERNNLF